MSTLPHSRRAALASPGGSDAGYTDAVRACHQLVRRPAQGPGGCGDRSDCRHRAGRDLTRAGDGRHRHRSRRGQGDGRARRADARPRRSADRAPARSHPAVGRAGEATAACRRRHPSRRPADPGRADQRAQRRAGSGGPVRAGAGDAALGADATGRWQIRGGDEPGGRPWVDGQLSDGGRRHARQHLRVHRLQRDRFHRSPDGSFLHVQARTGGMQRSRYGAR